MKEVAVDISELTEMVDIYRSALRREYFAKANLVDVKNTQDVVGGVLLADAYESGEVEGKNAEARARSEAIFLNDSSEYRDTVLAVREQGKAVMEAEAERKCAEARISLIKAWLYSQFGAGD